MERLNLLELKELADFVGVEYNKNVSAKTLKEKISSFLSMEGDLGATEKIEELVAKQEAKKAKTEILPLSKMKNYSMYKKSSRRTKNSTRQVRCIVNNNNPIYATQDAILVTVCNESAPEITMWVTLRSPTHVPEFVLNVIRGRKYSIHSPDKDNVKKTVHMPEFSIEMLPPLSDSKLAELTELKALRNGSAELK